MALSPSQLEGNSENSYRLSERLLPAPAPLWRALSSHLCLTKPASPTLCWFSLDWKRMISFGHSFYLLSVPSFISFHSVYFLRQRELLVISQLMYRSTLN